MRSLVPEIDFKGSFIYIVVLFSGFAIGYASMGKTAIAEIQFAGTVHCLSGCINRFTDR